MAHTCHPIYRGKCKVGGSLSRPAWVKSETLSPKYLEQKGLEVAQTVEHLPSKCDALSSNSRTAPPKKKGIREKLNINNLSTFCRKRMIGVAVEEAEL
jgi:hypothetical protein